MSPDLNLPDASATERLGAALAAGVIPGRVLHLKGDLGSGKTTLVRGLLHGLGYPGRVKSPTYTLVEPYDVSSLHFYHFDFYRLRDATEWLSSGFRDYFAPDSFCVVEWPEKAGPSLPPPDVEIDLHHAGNARRALLRSHTPTGKAWLSSLRFS